MDPWDFGGDCLNWCDYFAALGTGGGGSGGDYLTP